MQLSTFGVIQLTGDDGTPLSRGRRKELVVLAYLACRGARGASRAALAALFWDDRPADRARLSLRQTLFRLRQLVPGGLAIADDDVRLEPDAVDADIVRFRQAAAAGEHDVAARLGAGEFLPGADDAGGAEWRAWLEGERAALRRLHGCALDALVADATARGAWTDAVAHATAWADSAPDDMTAHRRLTDTLVLAGRATDAVTRHAAFVARRRADGDAPAPELTALGLRLERAARAVPPSPGSPGLFSPDLVGRGDAFAELTAAWNDARAGAPLTVVVEGEEGIGKTRLVSDFVRAVARGRGNALRLHARAGGHDGAADHAIARELLAPLVGARGLAAAPPPALAALSVLLPALRERFPHLPPAPGDERELAASVARVLTDVSAEQPVLLVVDDLAAADEASRRLLLAVLRRIGDAPMVADAAPPAMLAVLTTRPGALRRADFRDAAPLRWIRLRALDAEQADALIASMLLLPADERRALSLRLHAETGGNPLDVIEIVSALVDEELLAPDASGAWRVLLQLDGEAPALPHSAREALARRLARLAPPVRALLAAVAGDGRPFDVASAARITGLDAAEVSAAVEQLLARRLVRRAPGDGTRYELSHRLVAELLRPAEVAVPARRATSAPVRWRRAATLVAAAAVIVAASLVARNRLIVRPSHVPAVLIASVRADARDSASQWMADGVARLVEARLSQTESVEPIPRDRVQDALTRAGLGADSLSPAWSLTLARRLDADFVATGHLRRADTILLLDLEIRRASNGERVRRVVVEGRDALDLADAASVQIWQSAGSGDERPRLAEVTTRSAEAYRQFLRARAAQAAGHAAEQVAALDAAIAMDSGFGSAMLERVTLARGEGDTATVHRLAAAFNRHRARIPLRDRLQWQASLSMLEGSPARAESALRSLMQRYPRDPRAYRDLAELYATQGRWGEAEQVTQSVLALDSSSIQLGNGLCVACLEYARLVGYRVMQGDAEGADAAARRLVLLLPATSGAWLQRAFVDASYGRHDSAVAAMRRALSLGGNDPWLQLLYGRILVMARRLDDADSLVRGWRADGSRALAEQADDLESVVALERGDLPRAIRVLDAAIAADPASPAWLLVRAHRLGRAGRQRQAAEIIERHVHGAWNAADPSPSAARLFAWEHALLADAVAATDDTVHLRALADSIERIGAHSYYGRDWRLHHHVRGLVAMRGHRYDDAIRELEQARFGRPGWTRTLVELANAYLAAGRPAEAVRTLRTGYEGWPDAMARYASRSELDRLMATAFARAGARDSAKVYAGYVTRAEAATPRARGR